MATDPLPGNVVNDAALLLRQWAQLQANVSTSPIAAALSEHGQVWQGSCLGRSRRGIPQHCYANAYASAVRSSALLYAEGWALNGELGFPLPIAHAWLIDTRTGNVIERTWNPNPAREHAYLGLVVPSRVLREAVRRAQGLTMEVLAGDWARDGWVAEHGLGEIIAANQRPSTPKAAF